MAGMNKLQNNENGLPPPYPKSTASRSSAISVGVSAIHPLTPGSLQGWMKPRFMNPGGSGASGSGAGSSGGTKPYFSHFDPKTTTLPMVSDLNNQKSQNPSLRSDKNPMPTGDNINSAQTQPVNAALDPKMEGKRLRRIVSNRVSAQRSRMKKLQYINDMEKKVKALEAEISALSPQVTLYKNQQKMLEMEHKRLTQRMATYTNRSLLRNAEIAQNKAEVTRLRQLHLTQLQERMQLFPFWESVGLEEMAFMNSNQGQYGGNTEGMNRMKQLAAECGGQYAETNGIDWLNVDLMQPQNPGQMTMMPGWELGLQMQMSSQPEPSPIDNMNFNLGGIEQFLSMNGGQNF